MPVKGGTHTSAVRAKLRAINKHNAAMRRDRNRIAPSELRQVERTGTGSPKLAPYERQAADGAFDLSNALGGYDALSVQQRLLVADFARTELVQAVVVAMFRQTGGDPELVPKLTALMSQRRATLQLLGINHLERELELPAEIVRPAHENRASTTTASGPDLQDQPVEIGADKAQNT